MVVAGEFGERRAPYAPISALERFFERIRDRSLPDHVDHRFLQKLNVASNNEYSLLSALKFLGVLDDRGRPTMAYRHLQSTDRFRETLKHLVETAYAPVFESGVFEQSEEDLVNYFRLTSSASQAKNAARFFIAVSRMAGIEAGRLVVTPPPSPTPVTERQLETPADRRSGNAVSQTTHELVLVTKAKLLEKLPPPRADWSAEEYQAICDRFLEMLHALET